MEREGEGQGMRPVRTSRNLTLLDLPLFSSAKNFDRLSRRCWHSRPPYYFRPSLMQDRGAKFCSHRVGHRSALAQNASRGRSSFARIDFVPRPSHANAIHLHARTTVSFVVRGWLCLVTHLAWLMYIQQSTRKYFDS